MAYKVVPTVSFEAEYDKALHYLASKLNTPQAARSLFDALDKARGELQENPFLHAVSRKPLLEELNLREKLARSYVLIYRVDGDTVYLEHLFHQTQDFEHACNQ